MRQPESNDIARLLLHLESGGSFATRREADAGALEVRINGYGKLTWPVTDGVARKLCALARPAHHGYKSETRLDKRIRDT